MRTAVIMRDGVLHYALRAAFGRNVWYIFCEDARDFGGRHVYQDDDIEEDRPTCVRCLGEEALRGKDLEPIELD